ncbi:MAG: exodeoxyribonuclease VII large subunit [Nitrospirae bacterium]|jgi:exodeoxyribonuclease VII large subunit|nr:exodeoxyribonuclease VII large subunit [Nitrospirota bacterium]
MKEEGAPVFQNDIRPAFTVTELTEGIGLAIEGAFPGFLHVEGEISNLKESSSGHAYFTLKDSTAQIRGVFFRGHRRNDRFLPREGEQVLATGRLNLYRPRGEYQIVVHAMEPAGIGKFFLEFRRVQRRLQEEGLLLPGRKRALPFFPSRIALVTSLQGAVVWDFIRIAGLRNRSVSVVILPVRVQGEGAVEDIVEAFTRRIPRLAGLDAVVLARGGGSVEDLWPFNNEYLARTLLACPVPVVSAVGHETNITIADLVSDLRVATPSEAAEKLVPHAGELLRRIRAFRERLEHHLVGEVRRAGIGLFQARDRMFVWPHQLSRYHQRRERGDRRLTAFMERKKHTLSIEGHKIRRRIQESVFSLLRHKRGLLEDVVRRIRTPYALYVRKRDRREAIQDRLRETIGVVLCRSEKNQRLWEEALVRRMRDRLALHEANHRGLTERLRAATPFSALEKGFAILFHAHDRTLVSPTRLPHFGELLLARIPGFEIGLEVRSIEPRKAEGG